MSIFREWKDGTKVTDVKMIEREGFEMKKKKRKKKRKERKEKHF